MTPASSFAGIFTKVLREIRQRREIVLGHAHQLVVLAIAGDLHVMIFQQLETNFLIGQQAHQLEEFFRRDGAGAFFFDLGFAGCADAQLEIRGGDGEAIALRFTEEVRQNREWWSCARPLLA